jgi:diadenosine tetraphosphatase ApaH/serine/threonine PP2A family protein phosphatase
MEYAVISDVHANLEALEAVLADIKGRGIKKDRIFFCGDAVGYGPDPNRCVELIKENTKIQIAGNHDWAVLGMTDITYFNPNAKAAIRWTDDVITPEGRTELESYSLLKRLKKENVFLVHGSPKEPEEWHYLLTLFDAEVNFNYFEERLCFIGHSHVPFIIEKLPSGDLVVHKEQVELGAPHRYIVNCGSVGQPRDGDPRACYALFDDKRIELVRVAYDIDSVQKKMSAAGLPLPLIERLRQGL